MERGGWLPVSAAEESHGGGPRLDPAACSRLLSAAGFSQVAFSHALVVRLRVCVRACVRAACVCARQCVCVRVSVHTQSRTMRLKSPMEL